MLYAENKNEYGCLGQPRIILNQIFNVYFNSYTL